MPVLYRNRIGVFVEALKEADLILRIRVGRLLCLGAQEPLALHLLRVFGAATASFFIRLGLLRNRDSRLLWLGRIRRLGRLSRVCLRGLWHTGRIGVVSSVIVITSLLHVRPSGRASLISFNRLAALRA